MSTHDKLLGEHEIFTTLEARERAALRDRRMQAEQAVKRQEERENELQVKYA
jgi:hypothetical protein